jgi:putative redox protein
MSLKTLIEDSRSAIDADPANAAAAFKATGQLVGTTEVAVRAGSKTLTVDEPPALGGTDLGANPVEHALIALASCQAITYRFWAAQLGIELDSVEVTAEGDLDVRGFFGFDDAVRPGFTAVRLKVTPIGPESAARYQRLADAVDEHCPVLDLFSNATPVERAIAVTA